MIEIVQNYAGAIFSLAKAEGRHHIIRNELTDICKLLEKESELASILNSYLLSKEEKNNIIAKIFPNLSDLTSPFIMLLVRKQRFGLIAKILQEYNHLLNLDSGISEGIIYSINELSEKQIADIEESTAKKLGYPISLRVVIKPDIIGGIQIITKEKLFDLSIKSQIENMKKEILGGLSSSGKR